MKQMAKLSFTTSDLNVRKGKGSKPSRPHRDRTKYTRKEKHRDYRS